MAKRTRRKLEAAKPVEPEVDRGYTPPVETRTMVDQGRDGRVTDMTGGPAMPSPRPGHPVGEGGRRPIGVRLPMPPHEHDKLARASRIEVKPMVQLARECIKIGLLVKEAQRNGEEVVVMSGGRRKMTLV